MKKFSKKQFLNKDGHNSIAAIGVELELPEDGNRHWLGGNMSISDCTRTIDLELSLSSEDDILNSMYKLSTIMNTCKEALMYINDNSDKYLEIIRKSKEEDGKGI